MKLTKQQWTMIIVGVVVVFLVYWFFFRKNKSGRVDSSYKGYVPPTRVANKCQDCLDKFRQSIKGDPGPMPFYNRNFVEVRLNLLRNCLNTGYYPESM